MAIGEAFHLCKRAISFIIDCIIGRETKWRQITVWPGFKILADLHRVMEHWMNHGLVLSLVKLSEWRSLQLFQWIIFSVMAEWLTGDMRDTCSGSNMEQNLWCLVNPSFYGADRITTEQQRAFFLWGVIVHISAVHSQQGLTAAPPIPRLWVGARADLDYLCIQCASRLNMCVHASLLTRGLRHLVF